MNRFFETQKNDGNVFFYILLGVFLFGALTYALMQDDLGSTDTSPEEMNVAYTQILQYQGELRQAIQNVFDNGASEADIRFAHPSADAAYGDITNTPQFQIFSPEGGAATFRTPPPATNTTYDEWLFTGSTMIPQVGANIGDLTAVIPGVSEEFCDFYNEKLGLTAGGTFPEDTGYCLMPPERDKPNFYFTGNFSTNGFSWGTFAYRPAMTACMRCSDDTSLRYIYTVIYER